MLEPLLPLWSSSLFSLPMLYYPASLTASTLSGLFLVFWRVYVLQLNDRKQNMWIYDPHSIKNMAFVNLGDLTQYNIFQFYPFTWKFHGFLFLYSWVIFHYLHVPHFPYLPIGWWTSWLILFPGFYELSYNKQESTRVSVVQRYKALWVSAQEWGSWIIAVLFLVFWETFGMNL